MRFYYVTNIFDLHIFDNKTTVLSTFFEICKEMNFVSFFLNEGNFIISRLMVHLKCTAAAHYTNLNSSSINKPFSNYGPLNMLFHFFQFLNYVYFNDAFVKKLSKKIFFDKHFQNSFQDVVYYRMLGCQTL